MRRFLAACLALAVALAAFPAYATTTWSRGARRLTAVATCTTGTESAPSGLGVGATTVGLELTGLEGFTVYAEAAAAMTAGGTLQAYLLNPSTNVWARAPDLDLTVAALQYQAFAGFQVNAGTGRVAYVPNGIGQAVTLYLVGMPRLQ